VTAWAEPDPALVEQAVEIFGLVPTGSETPAIDLHIGEIRSHEPATGRGELRQSASREVGLTEGSVI
jgi:hypothetical protein